MATEMPEAASHEVRVSRATSADVPDLGYLWDYLGQTLPYDDDQLELSVQMVRYWGRFGGTGEPQGRYTPRWPRFRGTDGALMALRACDTPPAGTQPPAACSAATQGFTQEHSTAFRDGLTT